MMDKQLQDTTADLQKPRYKQKELQSAEKHQKLV